MGFFIPMIIHIPFSAAVACFNKSKATILHLEEGPHISTPPVIGYDTARGNPAPNYATDITFQWEDANEEMEFVFNRFENEQVLLDTDTATMTLMVDDCELRITTLVPGI